MILRALSVMQPQATLLCLPNANPIEGRTWTTDYRGDVVIHASGKFPPDCQDDARDPEFARVLRRFGYMKLPDLSLGAIIGVARLFAVIRSDVYGEYYWLFENPRVLDEPIPQAGSRMLWKLDARGPKYRPLLDLLED